MLFIRLLSYCQFVSVTVTAGSQKLWTLNVFLLLALGDQIAFEGQPITQKLPYMMRALKKDRGWIDRQHQDPV